MAWGSSLYVVVPVLGCQAVRTEGCSAGVRERSEGWELGLGAVPGTRIGMSRCLCKEVPGTLAAPLALYPPSGLLLPSCPVAVGVSAGSGPDANGKRLRVRSHCRIGLEHEGRHQS